MNDSFACAACPEPVHARNDDPSGARNALAARLRHALTDALQRLAEGRARIRHPDGVAGLAPRGSGHFHLASELFIQLSGWTVFQFPQAELQLEAAEILLIPPRLLHSERVGPEHDGRGFENLVVYAEDGAFRCHLAREVVTGVPGISYLEVGRHAQALRIQEWLAGASVAINERTRALPASPGQTLTPESRREAWAELQSRALIMAALSGMLCALDDQQDDTPNEPLPVSRVRVIVQNELGDPALSVSRLAAQTGYTADYLSNLFSVATGEHLSAYINRLRVERAARLLRESTLAGKEIAWACGFASPSYFIRAFRAHWGQTPKAWRQSKP